MSTKINFITVLITLGFAATSLAQIYNKGFIVTTSGDTLSGFIEVKESDFNPVTIKFKPTMDAEKRSLGIDDITYFSIDGIGQFKRYTVSISTYPIELKLLNVVSTYPPVEKAVFLRVLQIGRVISLFSFEDEVKIRFYATHDQAPLPQELVYRVMRNDLKFAEAFSFRDDLKFAAQRAGVLTKKLKGKIGSALYRESHLLKIVSEMNQVTTTDVPGRKKYGSGFVVGGGLAVSSLSYYKASVYNTEFSDHAKSSPSQNYWVSVGFDLLKNPTVGATIFRAELIYSQVAFETKTFFQSFGGNRLDVVHRFSANTFTLAGSARFNFYNTASLKAFIAPGLKASFSTYDNYCQMAHTVGTSVDYFSNEYSTPKSPYCSASLQTGVIIRKRYELGVGYNVSQSLNQNRFVYRYVLHTFQAGVIVRLY
jgi:hypothetical protein